MSNQIPEGICQCGCGQKTNRYTHTRTKDGIRKGAYARFVSGHNMHIGDRLARLWSHIDRRGPDECWEWQLSRSKAGYGKTSGIGKYHGHAHRVMWELLHGPIPPGLWVLHKCDNPPCCNPSHLFLGTRADNVRDMVRKHRDVGSRRLSDDNIRNIRALVESGVKRKALAEQYHVSYGHIKSIVNRRARPLVA